ncbi:hypothetical protein [Carboxylicivirga caseinilyticus]|uniref:hypothetical protein n=1 Tax=Carboxylicivirga caseinilyticus TaxID=3417572 RepID=UPI003D3511E9|nr:hypothetical protein [Marinilabiliaceae bacterium A049]
MTRITILTVSILISVSGLCQKANITQITKLCDDLIETSGLIYYDNSYWTINDSGDSALLYRIDEKGDINQTISIANGKNIDWEDIAQDDKHIYIGDTGNNNGNRYDFTIYQIYKSDIPENLADKSILAKAIHFRYEDQPENLQPYAHNFDCEALVTLNNQLGIFTKNWADGKTNFYLIDPQTKIAKHQFTFNSFGLITGAEYVKEEDKMLLIGYQYINQTQLPFFLMITDFSEESKRKETRIQLSQINGEQTEAICLGKNGMVISNEETTDLPTSLKKIELTY